MNFEAGIGSCINITKGTQCHRVIEFNQEA